MVKRGLAETKVNTKDLKWIREPKDYIITEDKVEVVTEPLLKLRNTNGWRMTDNSRMESSNYWQDHYFIKLNK